MADAGSLINWSLLAFDPPGWGGVLLAGLWQSVQIAIGGYALGLVLGTGGAMGKLYGGPVTRDLLEVYTTLVRAVPELVLILILYYAGTDVLNQLSALVGFGPVDISGLAAGIFVIGVVQGAYSTNEDPYRTLQEAGLRNLAQTVAGLHGLRLLHTDPFTSNFFVENGTNRIILIDLDALHRRPVITRGLMARNLSKFFLRMAMTPQEQAWFIAQFLAVARTGWNSNDFIEEVRRHFETRKGKGR